MSRVKRAYLKSRKVGVVAYEDSKVLPSRKTTYGSPTRGRSRLAIVATPRLQPDINMQD